MVHQKTYVRNGRGLQILCFDEMLKPYTDYVYTTVREDSQWYIKKPTSEMAEVWKLWFDEMFRKRTILLIMSIPW